MQMKVAQNAIDYRWLGDGREARAANCTKGCLSLMAIPFR
jgi:hypothetical protein